MATPINHDLESTVATGLWETIKGVGIGLLALPVLGALVLGGLAALTVGGAGIAALIGFGIGTVGSVVAAPYLAGGGALFGLFRGGKRISRENHAYQAKAAHHAFTHQQAVNTAAIQNMQQGYLMGDAEGEQRGIQKGAAMVMNQIQQQMAAEHAMQPTVVEKTSVETKPGKFAQAMASCKCESKVEAVKNQREAQAAAPHQVG